MFIYGSNRELGGNDSQPIYASYRLTSESDGMRGWNENVCLGRDRRIGDGATVGMHL